MKEKIDLGFLREKWPSAIVAREEIGNFTGGGLDPKYLANLDSQGKGPGGKFRCGRKVLYKIDDLIQWLEGRCTAGDE